jgi:hypothetical protein
MLVTALPIVSFFSFEHSKHVLSARLVTVSLIVNSVMLPFE